SHIQVQVSSGGIRSGLALLRGDLSFRFGMICAQTAAYRERLFATTPHEALALNRIWTTSRLERSSFAGQIAIGIAVCLAFLGVALFIRSATDVLSLAPFFV